MNTPLTPVPISPVEDIVADMRAGNAVIAALIELASGRGCVAVVVAHRPAILARTSHIILLRGGRVDGFGPRDEVLTPLLRPGGGRTLPTS